MIYLGADHGGYELKNTIATWLDEWGFEYTDVGAHEYDAVDDYPQFAFAVADGVAADEGSMGILACRSAAGVIIAANKVKGVRAVSVFNEDSAKHSREHNNANVIGLSGDWLEEAEAKAIVQTWLNTEFSGEERHARRVDQITAREEAN